MLFCQNCGSPLTPENRFCPKCGAPVAPAGPPQGAYPPQAPPPQDPGYPYPPQPPPVGYPYQPTAPGVPPYQQGVMYPPPGPPAVPPRSGSGKRIAWIVGGVMLIAAVVGVLWMTGVIFGLGPKESVEQAHLAYDRHDVAAFDKYFDSESVLGDFLDQLAAVRTPNEEMKQVRAHLPEVANAMKLAMLGLPPPVQTPEIHKLTDRPSAGLKEAMAKAAYKGITSESRTGSEATVGVKWGDATGRKTETTVVDFKLRRSGTHWKVVAIPGLAKLR